MLNCGLQVGRNKKEKQILAHSAGIWKKYQMFLKKAIKAVVTVSVTVSVNLSVSVSLSVFIDPWDIHV